MPAGCRGVCLGPWVQHSSASPMPPHLPTVGFPTALEGHSRDWRKVGFVLLVFYYYFIWSLLGFLFGVFLIIILSYLAEDRCSTVPILWFSCLFSYIL